LVGDILLFQHAGLNYGCWTADARLFNAISPQLPWVKWLGGFAP
jgi:hypothetical protein